MGNGPQSGGVHLGARKGWSMEKWMCWGSLGVSGLLVLLFILDLAMGMPFGGLSTVVNVLGLLSSAIVAYLSWDALSDLR